jgi:hypothetical protein
VAADSADIADQRKLPGILASPAKFKPLSNGRFADKFQDSSADHGSGFPDRLVQKVKRGLIFYVYFASSAYG